MARTPSTSNTSSSAVDERLLHEQAKLFRHRGFDFETNDRAATAALEGSLEHPDQVLSFFFDFDFGVPDDAERPLALDGIAREQPADE